jgi:hypothetical protein
MALFITLGLISRASAKPNMILCLMTNPIHENEYPKQEESEQRKNM